MSVSLATAKRRESEAATAEPRGSLTLPESRSRYYLSAAELADSIARAIASVPACRAAGMVVGTARADRGPVRYSKRFRRKSADDVARVTLTLSPEGEALAALLAERVTRTALAADAQTRALMAERHWMPRAERGSAADVLRFIRRGELAARAAESMPPLDGVPRSLVGRKYLADIATTLMRDSREWRDTAGSYVTRTELDRASGPMIESYDAAESADYLTAAQAREHESRTGEPLPAMPLDTADVSEAMALALMADGAPREAVAVALRMAAGVPLASVALSLGVSIATAKRRSAQGAAWLREHVPASVLVALMREAADALGHVVPADPYAPMLPASAAAYGAAVDAAKRSYRAAGCTPLPGRVDGASCALPMFRYDAASGESAEPRKTPAVAHAERVAALGAHRESVERFRSEGHPFPATAAASMKS